MQAKGLKTAFETETCSRCHGSGKYSYCQDYGDVCFKCAGRGAVLSKRGAIAQRFYIESCQVPMSSLKIGDKIQCNGITNDARRSYSYIGTVIEVKRSEYACTYGTTVNGVPYSETYYPLTVTTQNEKYGQSSHSAKDSHTVRIYRADDSERLQKALEFQGTLTKTGTVKKRVS